MWIHESFRDLDMDLVDKILASEDFHARAAAIHAVVNEMERLPQAKEYLARALDDPHPRVRLESVRGISFLETPDAMEMALRVADQPMDYWIDYTLEHTLNALEPAWKIAETKEGFLATSSEAARNHFERYKRMNGPGGQAVKPLEIADNVDAPMAQRRKAIAELAKIRGGNAKRGVDVFKRVCSACHMVGDLGKKFGPDLSDVGGRYTPEKLVTSIVMPNDEISKGYETVMVLTADGETITGFILAEDEETLSLGVADGKKKDVAIDDIEIRKPMKASSMPEGLLKQIAPSEFLDLLAYLQQQKAIARHVSSDGWFRAEAKNPGKVRKHQGMKEISRDAEIKLGPSFDNKAWNDNAHLFLMPERLESKDFVFHSEHDTDKPFVTIRLSRESEVRYVWLKNRLSKQFHQRAEGLAIWTSSDGENFEKVWQSEKPEAEWMAELPKGTKAKYVRVGLDGKGTFHLYQGAVYGFSMSPNRSVGSPDSDRRSDRATIE